MQCALESANFRRTVLRQPWLWLHYAVSLALLVFRRISQTLRLRLRKEAHRGLKQWPEWLDSKPLPAGVPQPLRFPSYAVRGADSRTAEFPPVFSAPADDPETALAHHRLGYCLAAALQDNAAVQRAAQQVAAWIGNTPAKSEPAWETYSCCERIVNLAVLLAIHPEVQGEIDPEKTRAFFADSLQWINSHLEYYGMARTNNHILNNARALVVAGSVQGVSEAVERGLLIFTHMSRSLFLPDGFLRERSSHYQWIVTNWLFDTLHFARATPALAAAAVQALDELTSLSRRVAQASGALAASLGDAATHIGDISPDAHPALTLQRLRSLYPDALTIPSGVPGRMDDWLLFSKGADALVVCGFPASYPIDYTTHGHSDLGSFIWLHQGQSVLVDSGRSSYAANITPRIQCGSQGHNTLQINGLGPLAESVLQAGRWLPTPYAKANIELAMTAGGFRLQHDGFARIARVGIHRRTVQLADDGLIVEDMIEGVADAAVEMFWHFPPEFAPDDKNSTCIAGAGLCLTVESAAADVRWQVAPFAAAYGDEQAAPVLCLAWQVTLPCTIKTVFRVSPCAE